jgi:hypothetical protein
MPLINIIDKTGQPRTDQEIIDAINALKKDLINNVNPILIYYPIILESLNELLYYRKKIREAEKNRPGGDYV